MKRTVVLIDDSKFVIGQLTRLFDEMLDFNVVAVGNDGVDAVNLYRKHKPDLITLDLSMPIKDGKTALLEILKEFPRANIMMISAVKGPDMLECMTAGAKGYIEKPFDLSNPDKVKDVVDTINEIFS